MPQIGWFEILIIVALAIIVIGPKDFPVVVRKIGNWVSSIKKYFSEIQKDMSNMENAVAEDVSLEDLRNDNVQNAEIRFAPFQHLNEHTNPVEIVRAACAGLIEGEKDFGGQFNLILCGMRQNNDSLDVAKLAIETTDYKVVGFDLAGAEENFPAKDHREAFYMILNNNINATIHAGEAFGPSSIHQAIHHCGAHRIGHGTRLKEDKDLMNYVNDHRITLEVCLTSNWQTRSIRSLKFHPLKFYYDQGIRVTLNTDNRLMSGTNLTNEYLLAHNLFGFKLHDFREMIIMAIKSAFIPHNERKKIIRKIANELEQDFGLMPEFIHRNK